MLNELEELFGPKEETPSELESMYFFLLEQGLSLKEIDVTPIPYIMGIMKSKIYWDKKRSEKQ